MVCEAMICDAYNVQTTGQFSISSDSYYSYVPCFKRENQQELWHNCRLGASDNTHQWYNRQLQYQQEEREQQAIKSRKRKSVKDDEQPVEQLKRLREDKKTIATSVSPVIQEMDWQYDSNADPNTVNCSILEQSSSRSTGCYWAAGNSSLISKQDHNHSDGDESSGGNTEYEKLLFTTHGCSVYHHQRAELLDNRTTTEF